MWNQQRGIAQISEVPLLAREEHVRSELGEAWFRASSYLFSDGGFPNPLPQAATKRQVMMPGVALCGLEDAA